MADLVDPKRIKDIKIKTGIVKRFCFFHSYFIIETYLKWLSGEHGITKAHDRRTSNSYEQLA